MIVTRTVLILTTNLFIFSNLFSQKIEPWKNPDYGTDSISRVECAYDLSTMSEFMKINLPDHALPSWRRVFKNCPASSKNIYLVGVRIFSDKIENTEDENLKKAYLDTLMIIYDKRIEYFNEEGKVLGRKAMDLLKYQGESSYEEAYRNFRKSTEIMQEETDANVLIGLSETGYAMYVAEKLSINDFLSDYIMIINIIEKQFENPRLKNRANLVSDRAETILSQVTITDCNNIETAFRSRYELNPDNIRLLTTIDKLLRNAGCEKSEFYRDIQLSRFKLNPSADISAEIAKHYIRNDNYNNALEYILKSYELENNPELKAQYALQIAVIYCSKLSDYKSSAEFAIKATGFKPDWADPYFVLATAYIEGIKECSDDQFERSAIYWLAVDIMEKAVQVDPSVADKAQNYIQDYSKYYPSKEECFFRSLGQGNNYKFGCWINTGTTVKIK